MDQRISEQLLQRGISEENYKKQVKDLKNGFASSQLVRACIPDDGIVILNKENINHYSEDYTNWKTNKKIVKFVPASGAASRMFKHLHQFKNGDESELITEFISNFHSFPFVEDLKSYFQNQSIDLEELINNYEWKEIIRGILDGLEYGVCPKGMVKFHKYSNKSINAFEEHLYEGLEYATGKNRETHIHFTIPEAYRKEIKLFIDDVIESENLTDIHVGYSIQLKSTDTVALDSDNNVVNNQDGDLLFRPGGHGALIYNLNSIDADLIFVKNIDNIVHQNHIRETKKYKIALAGYSISLQKRVFKILEDIDKGDFNIELVEEVCAFFGLNPSDFSINNLEQLKTYLNKPIRVCGMVRNEGEPGGGPFWVRARDGFVSCQIVEKAQIDVKNPEQNEILKSSTHFNPVDLICLTKNHKGEKFDLLNFIDPESGFVTEKSLQGEQIKALELPGLWNGAMANWLSVFVEVSSNTFNPVKNVNDLLRHAHQE